MRSVLAAVFAALVSGCGSDSGRESRSAQPAPPPPKILMFYPARPAATAGEAVTVCYGVEHAISVSVNPAVAQLKPSLNRCFEFRPTRTLTLTLYAKGRDGAEASKTFMLPVGRAATEKSGGGLISLFTASTAQARPGDPVVLCYATAQSIRVSLLPGFGDVPPGKRCYTAQPQTATMYTLTVHDHAGHTEVRTVRVDVKP